MLPAYREPAGADGTRALTALETHLPAGDVRTETLAWLGRAYAAKDVSLAEGKWRIRLRNGADPAAAISRLAAAVPPARVEIARPRLEDIFIQIVTGAGASEDAAQDLRAELRTVPLGVAV